MYLHNIVMAHRHRKITTLHFIQVQPTLVFAKSTPCFPKQGVCPWLSQIPKTALLMGADSGTNSIQKTSRLPGSASKERHIALHRASSTATPKGAALLRAAGRNFKIKLTEARPCKHTDLQKLFHHSGSICSPPDQAHS